MRTGARAVRFFVLLLLLTVGTASICRAIDTEARMYPVVPVGTNVAGAMYTNITGGLSFDGSFDFGIDLDTDVYTLYYQGFADWDGKLGSYGFMVPQVSLSGQLTGTGRSGSADGLGDPVFFATIGLKDMPAMNVSQLVKHTFEEGYVLALYAQPPWGDYDSSRVVNMGLNRWVVKPELAYITRENDWMFELMGNVSLFSDNTEYLGSRTLSQDPLYSVLAHVSHDFNPDTWASLGGVYKWAGETTVNGVSQNDERADTALMAKLNHNLSLDTSLQFTYVNTLDAAFGPEVDAFGAYLIYSFGKPISELKGLTAIGEAAEGLACVDPEELMAAYGEAMAYLETADKEFTDVHANYPVCGNGKAFAIDLECCGCCEHTSPLLVQLLDAAGEVLATGLVIDDYCYGCFDISLSEFDAEVDMGNVCGIRFTKAADECCAIRWASIRVQCTDCSCDDFMMLYKGELGCWQPVLSPPPA